MGSRTVADLPPTAASMAMNAAIFGYGGHSLVTPHVALKRLWWTEERVQAKVTRAFVLSKLRGEEREFLDQVVGFGEASLPTTSDEDDSSVTKSDNAADDDLTNLTSSTYMDWILTRARRLFLILTEVGVPDQIFGCIDDLWDDGDLPLALSTVPRLELTVDGDAALDKRFYEVQFIYCLRELRVGGHLDYDSREYIPLEHVDTVPPAVAIQEHGGRVHFPGRPDDVFMRRKVALRDDKGAAPPATAATSSNAATRLLEPEQFREDVKTLRALPHPHIAPIWASYTASASGFLLSPFVAEHTLASYLDHRTPPSYLRVPASQRPKLLVGWMRALADALAFLHARGVVHGALAPNAIWINRDNAIALADIGRSVETLRRASKVTKAEVYEFAAPESPLCKKSASSTAAMAAAFGTYVDGMKSAVAGPTGVGGQSGPSKALEALTRRRQSSVSDANSSAASTSSASSSTGMTAATSPSMMSTRPSSSSGTAPSSPDMAEEADVVSPAFNKPDQRRSFSTSPPRSSSSRSSFRSSSQHRSGHSRNFSRHLSPIPSDCALSTRPAATTPEPLAPSNDIFPLACLYLNLLTFLLEGKLTEFGRFRTYTLNVFKQRRARADTSFHNDIPLLMEWITHLETLAAEQIRRAEEKASAGVNGERKAADKQKEKNNDTTQDEASASAVRTAIPALLALVRKMLDAEPSSRPTAAAVRDEISTLLGEEPGAAAQDTKPLPPVPEADPAASGPLDLEVPAATPRRGRTRRFSLTGSMRSASSSASAATATAPPSTRSTSSTLTTTPSTTQLLPPKNIPAAAVRKANSTSDLAAFLDAGPDGTGTTAPPTLARGSKLARMQVLDEAVLGDGRKPLKAKAAPKKLSSSSGAGSSLRGLRSVFGRAVAAG